MCWKEELIRIIFFTVDVWEFMKNFNEKQALQFITNWDNKLEN
jgi:hypothetical protein